MYVFPAYAGMIPTVAVGPTTMFSVPRICGDDPKRSVINIHVHMCSPHMRG